MTRTSFWLASAAIVLLAAALRFLALDQQSLWSDEIYSVESSRWPLPVLLTVQDGHPPLYGLILKSLDQVRPSDINGRIVSAVAGVFAVGAMLALGCSIADRRTGLIAALMLAIAPLHVWYSREARMYSIVALCSIASSWFFVRGMRGGGVSTWVGYGLASAIGVFAHYLYGTVLLAQAAFASIARIGDRAARLRLAVAYAGLILVVLLAVGTLGDEAFGFAGRQRGFSWLAVPYTAFTFVGGFGLGPPIETLHRTHNVASIIVSYAPEILAAAVVGAALTLAALRALPALGAWSAYLVLWLTVPAVVVFAGAALSNGAYNVRYLLQAFPAFVLLAAVGLARAPRWYGAAALTGFALLSALSIGRDRLDERYAREDLRAAAHYLRERIQADDAVVVTASYAIAGLRYYGAPEQMAPLAIRPLRSAADADALLATLNASDTWLVLVRDWEDDPSGYLERAIAARGIEEAAHFPGVRILRTARAQAQSAS